MTRTFTDAARRMRGSSALALALAGMIGCGGPKIEYAEVEGKVTVNKKPVAGAIVRFYPIRPEKEQFPYSTGTTDGLGNYSLTHDGDKPGAVVGESKVVVSWASRDIRAAMGSPAPTLTIPLKYTVVTESPLIVTVNPMKEGSRQTINLKLED
jgi:hypothetical protein